MTESPSDDLEQDDMPPMGKVSLEALEWFTQLRNQPIAAKTQADFEDWCAQDPAHCIAYQHIAQFWESQPFNQALMVADNNIVQPSTKRVHDRLTPSLALAASVLLAVGIVCYNPVRIAFQADAYTSVGEQQTVQLADGSTALLDTDTAIAIHYQSGRREVKLLSGRAFFDVRHDPSHPFVVVTASATTQVVGTRFTVNTEADLPLAVQQGTVNYQPLSGTNLKVQAGEYVQSVNKKPLVITSTTQTNLFDWTQGRLIVRDQPLAAVLKEIDRYQPGIIVLRNDKLASLKVTGNYRLAQPEHILQSLAQIIGASFHQLTPYLTIID